ncbi:MAG: hypothetical protein KGZ25_12260 [Planctomycetes bacterium]|nr:hypothetical protein [Planctomycetota bacterium]
MMREEQRIWTKYALTILAVTGFLLFAPTSAGARGEKAFIAQFQKACNECDMATLKKILSPPIFKNLGQNVKALHEQGKKVHFKIKALKIMGDKDTPKVEARMIITVDGKVIEDDTGTLTLEKTEDNYRVVDIGPSTGKSSAKPESARPKPDSKESAAVKAFIGRFVKACNEGDLSVLKKVLSRELFDDLGEDIKRSREKDQKVTFKTSNVRVLRTGDRPEAQVDLQISVNGKVVEKERDILSLKRLGDTYRIVRIRSSRARADKVAKSTQSSSSGKGANGLMEFMEKFEKACNDLNKPVLNKMLSRKMFEDLVKDIEQLREEGEKVTIEFKPLQSSSDGHTAKLRTAVKVIVDGKVVDEDKTVFVLEKVYRITDMHPVGAGGVEGMDKAQPRSETKKADH